MWFPEGERSPDGQLKSFKPGLGSILRRIPVPVIPVFIHGTYEAWPRHRRLPRPGRLSVTFGEPVQPDALENEGSGNTPPGTASSMPSANASPHSPPTHTPEHAPRNATGCLPASGVSRFGVPVA